MRCIILLFVIITCSNALKLNKLENAVDLTWPFDNETVYWPNVREFEFTKVTTSTEKGFWYAVNEFCAGEHGGTHFDAPYHFYKDGWTVGEVPLSNLIAPGVMIDLADEVERLHHQAQLLPKHLEDWESRYGSLPEKCVILAKFGWSKYYSNGTLYLGIDEEGNINFPGVSKAAAEWIAQTGKVVGVGLDTPSVDPGSEKNFFAHRILSENQIYVLENVKIPSELPEKGFTLYVMPMKIQKGTGAPLRVIAVPAGK